MTDYQVDKICLLLVFCFLLYKYFTRNFNYWKRKGVPYLTPTIFVGNFGNIFLFRKTIGHALEDMYNKMPSPYFGIWVFNKPHFIVRSPELIKHVLSKDFKSFSDRNVVSNVKVDPTTGNALFFLKNPEWKSVRSKISPVFTSGKIKNMIPLINQAGEDMVAYLMKMANKCDSLEAKEVCAKYTTDVITSCAFGVQAGSFRSDDSKFRNVGRIMFEFSIANGIRGVSYFFLPSLVALFKMRFIPKEVTEFLSEVFWNTIQERRERNYSRNDLIDIIIKIKNEEGWGNLEEDNVLAQAIQFFLAGFETTSSTIAYTLYELCLNMDIQKKLRADIRSKLQEHNGITYEALQDMKYLNQVVCETLRKYPVLPFLDRQCTEDYNIPNTDITLEKGTPIFIPMFGLHYDSEYYPNPTKYDPDRFCDDNTKTFPNYAYLPFGSGPHNCIGERFGLISTKIGLVHILSHFEVEKSAKTTVPLVYEPKSFVLQSKSGLHMRFKHITGITDAA